MNKIAIVNWLLTRRCNLHCSYCGIVRNSKVIEYPRLKHYENKEMNTFFVMDILSRFHEHNPDCFHIFYGGEPLLRKDLPDIINHCNRKNIHYTIITNNSEEVQPMLETLITKTDYISGLTSSVDPIIFQENVDNSDRVKKSKAGLDRLIALSKTGKIKDLVAEITIDNNNLQYIEPLVKILDEHNISSSITFIDIAKNIYYDFSNINNKELLVHPTKKLKECLYSLIDKGYNIHMSKDLLNEIINILPANMDCKLEDNLHNLTIDADGKLRLCLRIKGLSDIYITDVLNKKGVLNHNFIQSKFSLDKYFACEECNWTCQLMSKMVDYHEEKLSGLLHTKLRGGK